MSWLDTARTDRPAKPTQEPFDVARPTAGGRGYAQAALEAEIARVERAQNGTRNNTLNAATFSLFQLVHGGELDQNTVILRLTTAARSTGLDDHEISATIASGQRAAAASPRTVPTQTRIIHAQNIDQTPAQPAERRSRLGDFANLSQRRRAEPQFLQRKDGNSLLYPGKDSYLYAETESGKSWAVALLITQCILQRKPIMVVDFEEGDELEIGTRLIALGMTEDQISDPALFRYLMIDGPCTGEVIAEADDMNAQVIVNEGMSVAYDIYGLQIKDNDSATAFRRVLVKPHLVSGRSVLTTDHVVKDRDSRGRYAIGGVMKLNAASGGAFLLVNLEGLAPGRRGVSNLYVTKDRPGSVKRNGVYAGEKFDPQVKRVGTLVVDDSRAWVNYLDVTILPPAEEQAFSVVETSLAEKIAAAIDRIAGTGRQANVRAIRAEHLGKNSLVDDEIERLLTRGVLLESRGARGARIFSRSMEESNDQ